MATPYRKFNTIPVFTGVIYKKFNTINVETGSIYRKFNFIFTEDNSILEDESIVLTEDALVRFSKIAATQNETVNLTDAILEIVSRKKFINSNSEITAKYNQRIYSNAHTKAVNTQKTILSDTYLTSKINQIINSNAYVQSINNQQIIISDAQISSGNIVVQEVILSDAHILAQNVHNISNYSAFLKGVVNNLNNWCAFGIRTVDNVNNYINMARGSINNLTNKIVTKKQPTKNINNDVRFVQSWQKAGTFGFQSLGKTYVKVYINSAEVTDVDVDSITIRKDLNQSHSASFELARAYDSSKPAIESVVEIKYNNWLLYKGYIVAINPADSPENIRIECQNKYWKQNRNNKYFFVGHKPIDNKEKYYSTIKEAILTEFSQTVPFGNFVPQTMDCFAQGESDCLTDLIQQSGNFGWYYDVDENFKLWKANQGSIINLDRQELGKNLGLYQVLEHRFNEDITNITNKYRVQMGDKIIRKFNSTGGNRTYSAYNYSNFQAYLVPDWNRNLEGIAHPEWGRDYGFNYPEPGLEEEYNKIFRVYKIPDLNSEISSWDDRYPPRLIVAELGFTGFSFIPISPFGNYYLIEDGYSIDYENKTLTLNEPHYWSKINNLGELIGIRAPNLILALWKKNYYTRTASDSDNPEEDIANPLMFFTDKRGDYPIIILKDLELNSLSIQEGYSYVDENGETQVIPSWDDTTFARDYADWQLSKICDRQISGEILLTLDTICFNDITLDKRIFVNGIMDDAMNIISLDYNINNFTVTIRVENSKAYTRTISLQSRGE